MADGKIDTGTGGINIDGKLYTFDTGLPEGEGGAQGNWSPGDITVDNASTPDLTVKTRLTLGQYMSKATLGQVSHYTRPNDFPVDPPTVASVTKTSILDPTTQRPLGPTPTSNTQIFSPAVDLSMTTPKIAGFKRGAAPAKDTDQNGNTLLPNAAGPGPAGGPYVKFSSMGLIAGPVKLLTDQQFNSNAYVPQTPVVVIGDGGDVVPSGTRDFYVPGGSFFDFGTADGLRTDMLAGILDPGKAAAGISRKWVLQQLALRPSFLTSKVNAYSVDPPSDPLKLINLVDPVTKIPTSATAASNNPSNIHSFAPAWQFSSYTIPLIAAGNKNGFFIKRGMWQNGTGVGGNDLLSKNSDLIANSYTQIVLDPNLYSPLDANPAPNVVIGDGGDVQPSNLRELHVVISPAQDGGTSKNILSPDVAHTLTQVAVVKKASDITTKNVFPLDPPAAPPSFAKLIDVGGFPMKPAAPTTASYFTKIIPLQSTYTNFTKNLDIKRGLAAGAAPDGNTLLPLAAAPAPAGGQFVKAAAGLNDPIASYTKAQLSSNLYDPLASPPLSEVVVGDGGEITATNVRPLHPTVDLATDGGTSDNILKPDGAHTLTVESAAARVTVESGKNKYPVGGVDIVNKTLQTRRLVDAAGNPLSVTAAQGNPSNPSYFTKGRFFAPSYTENLSKISIKRGLTAAAPGSQDGDELLPDATKPAPAGGHYVKDSGGLNKNIAGYTSAVVGPNLYDYSSAQVDTDAPTDVDFRPFRRLAGVTVDGGTSDNVFNSGKDKAHAPLSLLELAKEPSTVTSVNRYPVSPPGGTVNAVSIESSSPTENQSSPSNAYNFISWKNSPWWDSWSAAAKANGIKVGMVRGAAKDGDVDGNNLLGSTSVENPLGSDTLVAGQGPKPVVQAYVKDLLSRNRFNPDNRALNAPSPGLPGVPDIMARTEQLSGAGSHNLMYFAPPRSLSMGHSLSPGAPRNYGFDRLANIGNVLQLRAAGEISTLITDSTNPRSPGTTALDLLPGLGQIDIPRPVRILSVEDIITDLTDVPVIEFNDDAGKTFQGQLNHMEETFSSFAPLGMTVLTIAMVAVIIGFYDLLGLLFGLSSDSKINASSPTRVADTGRPGLGTFHGRAGGQSPDSIIQAFIPLPGSDKSVLMRFFGFGPTQRAFLDAVITGTKTFFGLSGGSSTFSLPAFSSPGFFATMARAIVRSVVLLVYDFKNLGKLLLSNPLAGIQGIFEILGKIRDSRMIKALNVFAMIGDNVGESLPDETVPEVDAGQKISITDNRPDDWTSSAFIKSRLRGDAYAAAGLGVPSNSTLKLSWASNRTPDLLLMSTPAFASGLAGDFRSQRLITTDPLAKTRYEFVDTTKGGRIDTATRERLEKDFDSEYVQFYFHDLRTNELLGFHAFLNNLTDDYSANYESVEAFGRVDPIKIYKNTSRKISLSFIIASTDKKDFDSMWTKINKLVTLVYPQYTKGKAIALGGNYQFVRPFSQQIGASPMIRLRIGDVISSNYSRFNLAGIFGAYDYGDAKFGGKNFPSNFSFAAFMRDPNIRNNYVIKELITPSKYSFKVRDRKYRPTEDTLTGPGSFNPGDYPGAFFGRVDSVDKDNQTVILKFVDYAKAGVTDPDGSRKKSWDKYQSDTQGKVLSPTIKGVGPRINGSTGILFRATFEDLLFLTDDSAGKFSDYLLSFINSSSGDVKSYATALKTFMDGGDKGTNSITRSFRSTGGRGLAGFIDSMNFDWLNQTRWDTTLGNTAPMMCKVSIGFTPIHDISPGLDSLGRNRAPVYSVGPYYSPEMLY